MTSLTILHIDMDAFFASVEQADNPALRNKCLVVGGASHRGVVAAVSYEARKYGIHSAMPIFQAKQKCPHLVIVPPRRNRYAELSRRIMSILSAFSPLVEQISIDEAFMDITGCTRLHGSPRDIAAAIKKEIKEKTGLTCSVGVAPNKFLAKIASDMNKPDGLTMINPAEVASFIQTLPIRKVPGVGTKAEEKLMAMGLQSLGQVCLCPQDQLIRKLGKFGNRLIELAQGRDDSPVTPHGDAKSISSETTLPEDTMERTRLALHLLDQAQSVSRQLRQQRLLARTITLKIKTADFQRHSRSQTMVKPTRSSSPIYQTALSLLAAFKLSKPVRLIGVGASGLQAETQPLQQDLFEGSEEIRNRKWDYVDQAVDAVSQRYGHCLVVRGSLTSSERERKNPKKRG